MATRARLHDCDLSERALGSIDILADKPSPPASRMSRMSCASWELGDITWVTAGGGRVRLFDHDCNQAPKSIEAQKHMSGRASERAGLPAAEPLLRARRGAWCRVRRAGWLRSPI